jgi:hypothetical protein
MATDTKNSNRKFIYAPVMHKLGERIADAERSIEEAREMVAEIEEADDTLARLLSVVMAVRDFRANTISLDELYDRTRQSLDGIRDSLPDGALFEIGPPFNRPLA